MRQCKVEIKGQWIDDWCFCSYTIPSYQWVRVMLPLEPKMLTTLNRHHLLFLGFSGLVDSTIRSRIRYQPIWFWVKSITHPFRFTHPPPQSMILIEWFSPPRQSLAKLAWEILELNKPGPVSELQWVTLTDWITSSVTNCKCKLHLSLAQAMLTGLY